jgi:hypothetical protein
VVTVSLDFASEFRKLIQPVHYVQANSEKGDRDKISPKRNLVPSNRDNKTAIELFLAGIQGWEAGLRRRMEDAKARQR